MTDRSIQHTDQHAALSRLFEQIMQGDFKVAARLEAKLAPLITDQAISRFEEPQRLLVFEAYRYLTYLRPKGTEVTLDLLKFGEKILAIGMSAPGHGVINVHLAEAASIRIGEAKGAVAKADWTRSSLKYANAAVSAFEKFGDSKQIKDILFIPLVIALATVSSKIDSQKVTEPRGLTPLHAMCLDLNRRFASILNEGTFRDPAIVDLAVLCAAFVAPKVPSIQFCEIMGAALSRLPNAASLRGRESLSGIIDAGLKRLYYFQSESGQHLPASLTAQKLAERAYKDPANFAKGDNFMVDAFEQALSANAGAIANKISSDFMASYETRAVDLAARLRLFCACPSIKEFGPHSRSELRRAISKGLLSNSKPTYNAAYSAQVKLFFLDKLAALNFLADVYDLTRADASANSTISIVIKSLVEDYDKSRPSSEEVSMLLKQTLRLPEDSKTELNLLLARALLEEGDSAQAKSVASNLAKVFEVDTIEGAESRLILAAAHLTDEDLNAALKWATQASQFSDLAGLCDFLSAAICCYIHRKQRKPTEEFFKKAATAANKIGGPRNYPALKNLDSVEAICQMVHDGIQRRSLHRWHRDVL